MDQDMPVYKFKLFAEVYELPSEETVAHEEVEEFCVDDCEAMHLARDLAWDLYGKVEDSQEDLPSYDTLVERYRAEWFDMSERDFDMAIDDMYIRTIDMHIDYWIQEVKE